MNFNECYPDTCSSSNLAARIGDDKTLQRLAKQSENDLDTKDNRGWVALHEASANGHVKCVSILIQEKKCELECETFEGETALILSARCGHVDVIDVLVNAGADVNHCSKSDMSPLHEAVSLNRLDCTLVLLKSNVDIDALNFAVDTPLKIAAENGFEAIIDALLSHGARLDLTDDNEITPIFAAAHKGHYSCLKKLILEAEKKDQLHLIDKPAIDGGTAIYLGAQDRHTDCLELLLEYGASCNILTTHPTCLPINAAIESNLDIKYIESMLNRTDPHLMDDCRPHPLIALLDTIPDYHHIQEEEKIRIESRKKILNILQLFIKKGIKYAEFDESCELVEYFDNDVRFIRRYLDQYFEWPYNYGKKLHVMLHPKIIDTPCIRILLEKPIDFFDPSDLKPYNENSLPPVLALLRNGILSAERIMYDGYPLVNHYRDDIIGNLTILEAFEYQLRDGPVSIQFSDSGIDIFHLLSFGVLILSGVEINSCLHIQEHDVSTKRSLLSLYNSYDGYVSVPFFWWLRFILQYCGFVHFGDMWSHHVSKKDFKRLKDMEKKRQTLSSLCRRNLIFHFHKKRRLQDITKLDLPRHALDDIVNEVCYHHIMNGNDQYRGYRTYTNC